jgi:hypothetical protein
MDKIAEIENLLTALRRVQDFSFIAKERTIEIRASLSYGEEAAAKLIAGELNAAIAPIITKLTKKVKRELKHLIEN